jgi:eukaryotic-like serine/threonine-protein kinase
VTAVAPRVAAPGVAPAGSELAPGYTVLQLAHRSRLFDVYEVWSVDRQCRCAAKVVRPERLSETKGQRRLLREGRLLLDLTHPNILRAYELFQRPQPVLIAEALPGMTIGYWIDENGPLKKRDLVHVGIHVSSALSYLHGKGVLHLDLKPGNLLASYGIVRVIDFSLWRKPGRGSKGAGTHAYLAPEQALGRTISAATDVWGLGTVLWEAAAGHPPFRRPEDEDEYDQLERRADPIRTHRRLPADLAEAIDACLDPVPAERPTLRELAELFDSKL